MKLAIEGTRDEVAALVRDLGRSEVLWPDVDGPAGLDESPDYEMERRRRDLQAWATRTPTDDSLPSRSVTVTMTNAPQAHMKGDGR